MGRWRAVLVGAAGLGLLATPALSATQGVRVGSFYFEDASAGDGRVVIDQGDRITFTFEGGAQHTATVDGQFDSGARSDGQTYTTSALTRAGTFTLFCRVHGASRHSTSLVVRATSSPAPSPSPAASPAPSAPPAPSPKASPPRRSPPSATATTAAPRTAPSPTAAPAAGSPAPTRTAAPSSSPSLLVIAAPSDVAATPTTVAAPPADPRPTSAAPAAAAPEGSATSSGRGWLLPWWLLLALGAAVAGAVVAARRVRKR